MTRAADELSYQLGPELEAELLRVAQAALPREACGLLLGSRQAGSIRIEAHWSSPNLAPDTDSAGFRLDPLAICRAQDSAQLAGHELLGCWHSHPSAAARPSRADWDGLPASWLMLILGPCDSSLAPRLGLFDARAGHGPEGIPRTPNSRTTASGGSRFQPFADKLQARSELDE